MADPTPPQPAPGGAPKPTPPPAAAVTKAPLKKDETRIAPPQKVYVPRPGMMDQVRDSQIWRSIFRHGYPNTVRNRPLTVVG